MEQGNQSKKSEKKIFLKFIIILVLCFFAGIGIAKITNYFSIDELPYHESVKGFLSIFERVAPVVFVALNIIAFVVSLFLYFRTKKLAGTWDGEDETVIDLVETRLNYPLSIANIMMICNMVFFPGIIQIVEFTEFGEAYEHILFPVTMITFLLGYAWIVIIQKLVVDLEKKLNPEKRGSVFDTKFQKEWEASCDEAQKQVIYRAGYKAFQAGNMACMILWLIALICQFELHTGIFPVICICTIWMVLTVSYTVVCAKLEAPK